MEFQGKQYEVDEDGYLVNLDEWSKELAGHLATLEEVQMTDAHW
jgi:tRNA 2-thiouridine synthesizing protein E